MLLSAFLLVAVTQAAGAAPLAAPSPAPQPPSQSAPVAPWLRDMMDARVRCGAVAAIPAADNVRSMVRPLGELPPGRLSYAVLRRVDGCVVPTPIRQVRPAR